MYGDVLWVFLAFIILVLLLCYRGYVPVCLVDVGMTCGPTFITRARLSHGGPSWPCSNTCACAVLLSSHEGGHVTDLWLRSKHAGTCVAFE